MPSPFTAEQLEKFNKIFFPRLVSARNHIISEKINFVHYTGANAALNMLKNREVWLRNSTTMNDFTEIEHGLRCLKQMWNDQTGNKFVSALDSIFSDRLGLDVEKVFNQVENTIRADTFLFCVSEHFNNEQDSAGRLSMWRGYGSDNAVAIVFKSDVFFGKAELPTFSFPVAYLDFSGDKFKHNIELIAENIASNRGFLNSIDRIHVLNLAIQTLRAEVICTKHPGFNEEREWRVVFSPSIQDSKYISSSIENISGTPQIVRKIPLKNIPEIGFNCDIATLIDKIIIGPARYPLVLVQAFTELLDKAKVPNPGGRVFYSQIPLRR